MSSQRPRGRHAAIAFAMTLALVGAPLVVGCSSADSSPSASYGSDAASEEYVSSEDGLAASTTNEAAAKSEDDSSVVIKTASVTLQTRSYDDALASVKKIISDAGGNVTNSRESGGYSRNITIEARVDPSKLEATVEELRGIDGCTVLSANVSADDVTRTYNDTERRIEILNEQYEHYKQMLENATTTEDMLEISDRMYDVMAEIKSYTDARDDMKHDADRSLLTVTLDEEVAAGESPTTSSPGNFAADAWDDSWGLFGQIMRSLIYALILLVPYLLLAAIIVGIVLLIRRRHPGRKSKKDRSKGQARPKNPDHPEDQGNPEGPDHPEDQGQPEDQGLRSEGPQPPAQ